MYFLKSGFVELLKYCFFFLTAKVASTAHSKKRNFLRTKEEVVISNFVVDTERTPAPEKPLKTNQLVSTFKFNCIEVRVCYFYLFYKQLLFLSSTCYFFFHTAIYATKENLSSIFVNPISS